MRTPASSSDRTSRQINLKGLNKVELLISTIGDRHRVKPEPPVHQGGVGATEIVGEVEIAFELILVPQRRILAVRPALHRRSHDKVLLDLARLEAVFAQLSNHSRKPAEIQNRIERLCSGPFLELFARRQRPGWTCLGNEIDGRDIRDALNDIAEAPDAPQIPPSSYQEMFI